MEPGQFSGWRPVLAAIGEDVAMAHAMRYGGGRTRWWSWAWLFAVSRGLKVLAVRRLDEAATAWTPAGWGGRLLRRALLLGTNVGNRLSRLLAKSEVSKGRMEGGVYLSDGGHIIVGTRSIGAGTVVHDHVTIGRGVHGDDLPEIGRNVWIGPRCVIYGRIRVADGVTLLPGTVLSRNVPAGAVLQGNPAQLVRRDFDNAELRRSRRFDAGALPAVPAPAHAVAPGRAS